MAYLTILTNEEMAELQELVDSTHRNLKILWSCDVEYNEDKMNYELNKIKRLAGILGLEINNDG